jgi:NADH-quinone oxidoreductase subunit N
LVGIASISQTDSITTFVGIPAVLFYGFVYAFMTFGAFAVAYVAETQTGSNEISALHGMSRRAMLPAIAMAIFMLSLTGVPPLSGFIGKLYLLQAAVEADLGWLAIVLVGTSVVSAFYYLRVVVAMFMEDPAVATADAQPKPAADSHVLVITIAAGLTVIFGIVGWGLLDWAQTAVSSSLL